MRTCIKIFSILAVLAGGAALGVYIYHSPPSELVLAADTVWSTTADKPLIISNRVVVPAGATLTIKPGTTVLFRPRAGLTIRGRLLAEGTELERIRLARPRVPFKLWAGIRFENVTNENRLTHIDIESAGSEGLALYLTNATVTIEHARFFGALRGVIRAVDSSLILRRSVVDPVGDNEIINARRPPVGGVFLIEGNTFYPNFGYKDVIDIADCHPPRATPQFLDNLFLGGGDDGIDVDKGTAYIAGNIFVNFHLRGHKKYADGISSGGGGKLTITNNLFVGNDAAVMISEGGHVTLLNNTFYRNRNHVVSLDERDSGPGGATMRDCILWQNGPTFEFSDRATVLVVSNSFLPEAAQWPGQGNQTGDPRFTNPQAGNFQLATDSPAAGRGAMIDPNRFPRGLTVECQ